MRNVLGLVIVSLLLFATLPALASNSNNYTLTHSALSNGSREQMQSSSFEQMATLQNIFHAIDHDSVISNTYYAFVGFIKELDFISPLKAIPTAPSTHTISQEPNIQFSWQASSDFWSGVKHYRVQFDTSATFSNAQLSDTITDTNVKLSVAPLYEDTYYWRIVTYDNFHNTSVSSVRSLQVFDTTSLQPPYTIWYEEYGDTSIKLIWEKSLTHPALITHYSIYMDSSPFDKLYGHVYTTISHAADTNYFSTIISNLKPGNEYKFGIRSTDRFGNEEKNTDKTVTVLIPEKQPEGTIMLVVTHPPTGERHAGLINFMADVDAPNNVRAQLRKNITSALFEYRLESDTEWRYLLPSGQAHEDNPDTKWPWKVSVWSDSFTPGTYHFRAVGTDIYGRTDLYPKITTIIIGDSASATKTTTVDNKGNVKTTQKVSKDRGTKVENQATVTVNGVTQEVTTGITYPEGALNQDAEAVVTILNPEDTATKAVTETLAENQAGAVIDITLSSGQSVFTPGNEPTLEMSYADDDDNGIVDGTNINADDLSMGTSSDNGKSWEQLDEIEVDKENKKVKGKAKHHSLFTIVKSSYFPVPMPAGASKFTVLVYPNPFVPGDGNDDTGKKFEPGNLNSGIIFAGISSSGSFAVYNIAGQQVYKDQYSFSGDNRLQWDCRNDAGNKVASGVYFYVIKEDRGTATGKFMIVR